MPKPARKPLCVVEIILELEEIADRVPPVTLLVVASVVRVVLALFNVLSVLVSVRLFTVIRWLPALSPTPLRPIVPVRHLVNRLAVLCMVGVQLLPTR